jgi:4-alpha-glucanotransferase
MTTRAHRMPFGAEVQADHSIREPETGVFLPPAAYPALALAVIGSHDLPTLRRWWEERDLDHKEQLGLFPGPSEAARQRQMRHRDRIELLQALRSQRLCRRTEGLTFRPCRGQRMPFSRARRPFWQWCRSTI